MSDNTQEESIVGILQIKDLKLRWEKDERQYTGEKYFYF